MRAPTASLHNLELLIGRELENADYEEVGQSLGRILREICGNPEPVHYSVGGPLIKKGIREALANYQASWEYI